MRVMRKGPRLHKLIAPIAAPLLAVSMMLRILYQVMGDRDPLARYYDSLSRHDQHVWNATLGALFIGAILLAIVSGIERLVWWVRGRRERRATPEQAAAQQLADGG